MAALKHTFFRLFFLLATGILGYVGIAPLQAEVRTLGVLPYNSNPSETLFEGQDGFLYGVLRETNLPNPKRICGAVYQLSPTGTIRYLHRFPFQFASASPNVGGAEPSDVLVMGKDGFLYGLTKSGGANGSGVFYRLSTDGTYEVIVDVPAGLQLANGMRSCLLGPDGALYGFNYSSHPYPQTTPLAIMRFGLDGTFQTIYQPSPESERGYRIEPLNEDHSLIRLSWVEPYRRRGSSSGVKPPRTRITLTLPVTEYGRRGIAHEVVLELPSGNVVSQEEFPYLTGLPEAEDLPLYNGFWRDPYFFSTRPEGRLFCSYDQVDYNNLGIPNRIILLNPQGQVTILANYGNYIINPDIPPPVRFLHGADGTIYFTSGFPMKGDILLATGTQINRLLPGQTPAYEKLADLDGYPVAALTESRDGHLYGVSWGPVIVSAEEDLDPGEQEDETEALTAMLTSRARSNAKMPRGAFRRTNPQDPTLSPVARPDRISLPANKGIIAISAFVLGNDTDPTGTPLTITEVSEPNYGTATIQPGVNGQPPHILYTPSIWPHKSDVVTYTVANAQGKTSVGQLRIRANLAAKFRSTTANTAGGSATPISLDSLVLNVRPTAKFAGLLKLNGKALPLTGRFNDTDSVTITRRLRKSNDNVKLTLRLDSTDGVRQLHYEITYLAETLTGTLAAQ